MIYNLVEAAQEFLSEIIPQGQSHGSVSTMYFLVLVSCSFQLKLVAEIIVL